MKVKSTWLWLGIAVLAGLGITYMNRSGGGATVDVTVPSLTAKGREGLALFNSNCAKCHGLNGAGTGSGPPLIHKIYEPDHHGDGAFQRAARNGVRAHHWQFGNMPPVPGVKQSEVGKIVTFIREVQRANGIM